MTEDQERQLRALLPVLLSVAEERQETRAQITERIIRIVRRVLG